MHVIDWIVIGIYFLLLLWLGFYKASKKHDEKDFILAGRKLSLPGFIATLVATWYGGILGVGENTVNYGIQTWFIFGLPYYVFGLLFAFFLAPKIRKRPHRSIPDHFNKHYGKKAGIISAVLILILASPAPYILSLGILLKFTLHWPLIPSIIFAAGLSLMYLWFGGFRSVIRTDYLQFILMFTGFILIILFAWKAEGSPLSLVTKLPKYYFELTGGHSFQYILVWFFIALWTFIDPGFYQRTAAANSPETAKKGILISIGFWFIFDILTVTTGLYAALLTTPTAAMAYPELALTILPPFIYGMFLIGLFSTIMSTIDSNGFISAITFGRDITWRIKGNNQESDSIKDIRAGLIVTAVIAVIMAVSIPSIVRLWYVLGSIIVPGILFPFLLTFTQKHIDEKKIIMAILIPVFLSSIWFFIGWLTGAYPLNLEPFYPGMIGSVVILIFGKTPSEGSRTGKM